jgi:hypothetical protein
MLRSVFLFLAAVALAADGAAERLPSGVPDIIENERAGLAPVWVSAEAALDAAGDLRSDIIASHKAIELRRRLERNAATKGTRIESEAADGCDTTTSYVSPHFSSTASADDLVKNSRYIFSGSVTDLRQGFYFGSPGTLLAVRPKQWLKHETEAVIERPIYIFFSQAKIKTPHGTICSTPVPRVPRPSVGDEILIFAYHQPLGRDAGVFELRPDQQMSFEGSAGTYVPKALLGAPNSNLATIVTSIREHPRIGERPGPQKVW